VIDGQYITITSGMIVGIINLARGFWDEIHYSGKR